MDMTWKAKKPIKVSNYKKKKKNDQTIKVTFFCWWIARFYWRKKAKKKKKEKGDNCQHQKNQKIWFKATNVPLKLIYKCFVIGNNQAQSVIEAYEFLLALIIIIPIILISSPID